MFKVAKKKEYTSVAKTTSISVSSRASVKINESYYTVEYHEERQIPDVPEVNLEQERKILWDVCNMEVDSQIEDILKTYKR